MRASHAARWLVGFVVGCVVSLWVATFRVRVFGMLPTSAPVVFAFWHGEQFGLLAARRVRRRSRAVMVSHSLDGWVQAGTMRSLGIAVVRGSSTRGGATALRALHRRIVGGDDVLFAADGPRGPRHESKRGAAALARQSGALLVPIACKPRRALTLRRAWDRFEIPLPFTTVDVRVGRPIDADAAVRTPNVLDDAIRALTA